jgi:hypothetical protein
MDEMVEQTRENKSAMMISKVVAQHSEGEELVASMDKETIAKLVKRFQKNLQLLHMTLERENGACCCFLLHGPKARTLTSVLCFTVFVFVFYQSPRTWPSTRLTRQMASWVVKSPPLTALVPKALKCNKPIMRDEVN